MAEELNGCGICIKVTVVIINVIYLLIGLGVISLGIYFFINEKELSILIGINATIIGIVILLLGIVLLITAILGIIGAAADLWCLLIVYCLIILGLIGLQGAGGIWSILSKDTIEVKIDKQILGYIQNYTTDDNAHYNEGTNFAIDIIQQTFHCCGLTGPTDWLLYNPTYTLTNGVPSSCECDSTDTNKCLTVLYTNFGVWKQGCNDTFYHFMEKNLIYFGISAFCMIAIQFLMVVLTIGLCVCVLSAKNSHHYNTTRYVPLEPTGISNIQDTEYDTYHDSSPSTYDNDY